MPRPIDQANEAVLVTVPLEAGTCAWNGWRLTSCLTHRPASAQRLHRRNPLGREVHGCLFAVAVEADEPLLLERCEYAAHRARRDAGCLEVARPYRLVVLDRTH